MVEQNHEDQLVISEQGIGPGVVVLHISGELDIATSPQLRKHLVGLLEAPELMQIILDLAGLEFVDSTGVSLVVGALKRLRQRGGDMVLRSPQPSVGMLLTIMGLDRIFTIEP